jgi:hypothetical protein
MSETILKISHGETQKASGDLQMEEAAAFDPFDLASLRMDQSFADNPGVKKLLNTVPVRKPQPQDYNRVHPDPQYRAILGVIHLKEDREMYLITPVLANELPGEYLAVQLYTAINRQGVVFLWPVPLPRPDGKVSEWHRSAAEGAELAMKVWVRLKANMSLGAYEHWRAEITVEPNWPELPYQELLRIAFKNRYIDNLEHPVVKRLLGQS